LALIAATNQAIISDLDRLDRIVAAVLSRTRARSPEAADDALEDLRRLLPFQLRRVRAIDGYRNAAVEAAQQYLSERKHEQRPSMVEYLETPMVEYLQGLRRLLADVGALLSQGRTVFEIEGMTEQQIATAAEKIRRDSTR
jgi:hypothetical protein